MGANVMIGWSFDDGMIKKYQFIVVVCGLLLLSACSQKVTLDVVNTQSIVKNVNKSEESGELFYRRGDTVLSLSEYQSRIKTFVVQLRKELTAERERQSNLALIAQHKAGSLIAVKVLAVQESDSISNVEITDNPLIPDDEPANDFDEVAVATNDLDETAKPTDAVATDDLDETAEPTDAVATDDFDEPADAIATDEPANDFDETTDNFNETAEPADAVATDDFDETAEPADAVATDDFNETAVATDEPANNFDEAAVATDDFNEIIVEEDVQYNPELSISYHYIGWEKAGISNFKGAIEDYQRAIALNPENAVIYNSMGIAKASLGNIEGAITDYNQAITMDPNYATAYHNRGRMRANSGDLTGAIEDYRQALHASPQVGLVYLDRAMAQYLNGDARAAVEDLEKALELGVKQAQKLITEITAEQL